ncbi:unnamed protein product [Cunninghamella blakesleeana]
MCHAYCHAYCQAKCPEMRGKREENVIPDYNVTMEDKDNFMEVFTTKDYKKTKKIYYGENDIVTVFGSDEPCNKYDCLQLSNFCGFGGLNWCYQRKLSCYEYVKTNHCEL